MPTSTEDRDLRRAARITLPLTEDENAIDWSRVRQSTARKFEGILQSDPNIRAAYKEANGIQELTETPFDITEANVHSLLDGMATINASIFQLIFAKWVPHPLAKHIPSFRDDKGKPVKFLIEPDILQGMKFTEEQHKELDPRAVRIARRYQDNMPMWLKKNLDLYLFGAMFLGYVAENAKMVMQAQVMKDFDRVQTHIRQAQAKQARPIDSDVPKKRSTPVPINGEDAEAPWMMEEQAPPPEGTQPGA